MVLPSLYAVLPSNQLVSEPALLIKMVVSRVPD
jgi:hypothetical protein